MSFYALTYNLDTGEHKKVRAASLDPHTIPKNQEFFCIDGCCRAPVTLVREHEIKAVSDVRRAHFRVLRGQHHSPDCSEDRNTKLWAAEIKTLEQALQPDSQTPIILRLNLDPNFQDPLHKPKIYAFCDNDLRPLFGLASHGKEHAIRSIHNVETLIETYNKIAASGGTAMARSYVERDGHFLPLSDFVIMRDERKLENMLLKMQQIAITEDKNALGFPRLFLFSPDKATRERKHNNRITGIPKFVSADWTGGGVNNNRGICLSMFGHREQQDRVLDNGFTIAMIATPTLSAKQARNLATSDTTRLVYLNFMPPFNRDACIATTSHVADYQSELIKGNRGPKLR